MIKSADANQQVEDATSNAARGLILCIIQVGLFVCFPQPFAFIAGSVDHVNLTSTPSFPRT